MPAPNAPRSLLFVPGGRILAEVAALAENSKPVAGSMQAGDDNAKGDTPRGDRPR
jgi:hypothetical protein